MDISFVANMPSFAVTLLGPTSTSNRKNTRRGSLEKAEWSLLSTSSDIVSDTHILQISLIVPSTLVFPFDLSVSRPLSIRSCSYSDVSCEVSTVFLCAEILAEPLHHLLHPLLRRRHSHPAIASISGISVSFHCLCQKSGYFRIYLGSF